MTFPGDFPPLSERLERASERLRQKRFQLLCLLASVYPCWDKSATGRRRSFDVSSCRPTTRGWALGSHSNRFVLLPGRDRNKLGNSNSNARNYVHTGNGKQHRNTRTYLAHEVVMAAFFPGPDAGERFFAALAERVVTRFEVEQHAIFVGAKIAYGWRTRTVSAAAVVREMVRVSERTRNRFSIDSKHRVQRSVTCQFGVRPIECPVAVQG